jgi:Insertion element 4 transposase N-terminal/Transposase DDE domain
MARTSATVPSGCRITDRISLGVLSKTVPAPLIDAVLAETGRQSRRQRHLPARVVVYYVIALTLYARASYGEVLRCLLEGLRWLHGWRSSLPVASKSGISQARTRLGAAPLKCLFERVAVPLADRQTPGAWYRGRRLVSLDGTTVDVADVPDNVAAFGRPAAARGRSGFPQLRLVALTETGPRAMIAVAAADFATGETTLARRVIGALSADMLCLADRGFVGFAPWSQACATGAALLWRVRRNQVFPCHRRLPDGSHLSKLYASSKHRRRDDGLVVRVIEYRLDDVPGAEPLYRLITTLSDPATAPAAELAALYHERWESETAFAELKTSLPGGRLLLRSKTPELVWQEFYGLLLAHYAIRRLMHEASAGVSWDPDRLSFIHTVRIVRRNLPFHAAFSPAAAP